MAKEATAGSTVVPFKTDQKMWGVTGADDERLTLRSFGDYKSPIRLKAEVALSDYLNNFSKPRYLGGHDSFSTAVAVAPPGTGKSRLLDDTVRGLIAAELQDGKPTKFFDPSDKLLLPITFNGSTTAACVHDVASRCVLDFFCGQPKIDMIASDLESANRVLHAIDGELSRLAPGAVAAVEVAVLSALEALFFNSRGGSLGRSVLLIDEISKSQSEKDVYRNVVDWVDNSGIVAATGRVGRRGAVFTGLSVLSAWAKESDSGRMIASLALGLFDLFDPAVQRAVMRHVNAQKKWAHVESLPEKIWRLLASTGGRPRDVENILGILRELGAPLDDLTDYELMHVFHRVDANQIFCTYLLPSMLGVKFTTQVRMNGGNVATRFGNDVGSRALLNAELLVQPDASVPAVSLRFAFSITPSLLQSVVWRLVEYTTFRSLDQSGKDFERVCVLLLHAHLLLQHRVRCGDDGLFFWPQGSFTDIGGAAMPTGAALDVFARTRAREQSLFAVLAPSRVFEAPGSTIHRSIVLELTVEPPVMLWHDLWTPDVCGGSDDKLKATTDVAWQPSLVYFTLMKHAAVDFMLLVGAEGGTGASKPHVYMFQCKAHTRDNFAAAALLKAVDDLDFKLDVLFSDAFERHVLRRAGIASKKQVTLCIAALEIGDNFTFDSSVAKQNSRKVLIAPPFNVVLFDGAAIADLGGAAFRPTHFMHDIRGKLERK